METLTTNRKNKIELYASIYELPIKRSNAYNKYSGMDADIGSDKEAVGTHYDKLLMFLGSGKDMNEEAQREAANLYMYWQLVHQGINPKHLSFACMVHSVDGVVYNDLTESGLQKVVDKLAEIEVTEGEIREFLDDVKKNFRKSGK